MIENSINWIVAQIKPNMLHKAIHNLERQSFHSFAPQHLETIRSGEKFKNVKKLIFPGYIFIKTNLKNNNFRSINSTIGISRLIKKSNGEPGIIPNNFIDELKKLTLNQSFLKKKMKAGTTVKLIKGPFNGYIGTILSLEKDNRIKVLFKVINDYHSLSCPSHFARTMF